MAEMIQLVMCQECDAEVPQDKNPDEFHDVQVRLVSDGISIWCRRHKKQIIKLDIDPKEISQHAHLSRVHGQKVN